MTQRLTALQARRVALSAQGFGRRRPSTVRASHVNAVIERLGLFQIDSVNVLARAHYVPLFSRLGPYDRELLHRAAGRSPRRLFEYWAHEAALVDVRLQPDLRFRMRSGARMWGQMEQAARDHPGLLDWVVDEVAARGPLSARELAARAPEGAGARRSDHWGWNWSVVKGAVEYLFYKGEVTAARRNAAFERLYDLPERVLPPAVLAAPEPDEAEAHRRLVRFASRAHGVATGIGLRDYFRLDPALAAVAVDELVDAGELLPVTVKGWTRPAYLHPEATVPRQVRGRALLSPFDPLVFERARTHDLFGFHYRIEIYVPAHKRVHGYYVLPFLLDDRLVARVDLKADRAARVLRVQGSFAEPDAPAATARELALELADVACWLDLDNVVVEPRGDLAASLAAQSQVSPTMEGGAQV
ncbi:MAG: crosslink repair DNA glycosylase YcaQ family protein [Nocardioidaceae bacterium]|nr:crosslink repair DNA glycosylase YcaQ family protein [Nocardioidaceae bacterium]